LKIKPDSCSAIPEMLLDDKESTIETRRENAINTNNPSQYCLPVNVVKITLVRNPMSCIITIFVPTLFLSAFLFRCCWIDNLKPRMENVSIAILGEIAIFG